jgi:hypothetical protein
MKQPVRIAAMTVVAAVFLGLGVAVVVVLIGGTGGQAEAAKPATGPAVGRLIELPLAARLTPMVEVGDCHEIRLMWKPSGTGEPTQSWTSPDGTERLLTEGPGGIFDTFTSSMLVGGASRTATGISGGTLAYPYLQWELPGATDAWAWCSFH